MDERNEMEALARNPKRRKGCKKVVVWGCWQERMRGVRKERGKSNTVLNLGKGDFKGVEKGYWKENIERLKQREKVCMIL